MQLDEIDGAASFPVTAQRRDMMTAAIHWPGGTAVGRMNGPAIERRYRYRPMATQRHHLELFADYHQFYLQDEVADGNLGDSWTPEATDRLLAITEGTIGVGTLRNMKVQWTSRSSTPSREIRSTVGIR